MAAMAERILSTTRTQTVNNTGAGGHTARSALTQHHMNTLIKISELTTIYSGYLSRKRIDDSADGTHHLVQLKDFNADRTNLDTTGLSRFSPDRISSERNLKDGDVLYLSKGANNFAFAVHDIPTPSLAASYFFVLRPTTEILPDYLAWILNQKSTKAEINRQVASGARIPVVRKSVLEELPIPLPSLAIQKTIVELNNLQKQERKLMQEIIEEQEKLCAAIGLQAATSGNLIGDKL